jgi:hypothetical protein
MKPFLRPSRRMAALAIAFGIAIAACSEQATTPGAILSQAQADSLGDVVVANVQNELDAATASGGIGFVPGAGFSSPVLAPPTHCVPEISPLPPTNSDGDRVPDSIRITFTDCVIGFRHGADTIRGSIDIIDPTPLATDHSLKQVFTDFARVFVDRHGHFASITTNGARQAIRDSSELSQHATDFRTDYLFGNGDAASDVRNWDVVFTADVDGSITRDAPLPSGTLTVDGISTFTRNSNTVFQLQATTSTPLHYDATCADRPRFDTGAVTVEVTRKGTTATIMIEFMGCGQYTVTRT